jgi:hypothetical protein
MISRRRFIGVSGLSLGESFFGSRLVGASSVNRAASSHDGQAERLSEEWMNAWMDAPTRGEQGALYLGPVTVPVGFVTDLASIPRIFYSALRPDGEYTYPAIIHDYLYWTQTRPKDTADMIFKFGMQDFDINGLVIKAIYEAVHYGGSSSWKHNQELKLSGERRFLKQLPNDPKPRWAVWKNKPELFFSEK